MCNMQRRKSPRLRCYAILHIKHKNYWTHEFFDVQAAGFDDRNVQGLEAFFINVYKLTDFDLYWTALDPDHFKELHQIEEYAVN